MSRIGESIETENRLIVGRAGGRREWASFWGDKNVLKLDSDDG